MEGRRQHPVIRRIGESWAEFLAPEFKKTYMRNVGKIVANQRKLTTVYPEKDMVFRAYKTTPYTSVRVVIIGQDPYHNGHADGLAFSSVKDSVPVSLRYIFQEIARDLGYQPDPNPDLTRWATQGVLLLNTALTVRIGEAGSHKNIGWERFTARTLKAVSLSPVPTVFLLWGSHAKGFKPHIDPDNHLILEAAHPASEAYKDGNAGFLGCGHFSKTNNFLIQNKLKPIQWK